VWAERVENVIEVALEPATESSPPSLKKVEA